MEINHGESILITGNVGKYNSSKESFDSNRRVKVSSLAWNLNHCKYCNLYFSSGVELKPVIMSWKQLYFQPLSNLNADRLESLFLQKMLTSERKENRKESIRVKLASIFTWNIVNVHHFLKFIFGIIIHRKWKEFAI